MEVSTMCLAHPNIVYCSAFKTIASLDTLIEAGGEESFPYYDPDPIAHLTALDAERRVEVFVAGLPERERAVIRGVYWDGTTQRGIAAQLGISQPAVTKILRRALARARTALSDLRNDVGGF